MPKSSVPNIIKACCVLHNLMLDFPGEETYLLAECPLVPDAWSDVIAVDEVIHLPEDTDGVQKIIFLAAML